MQRYSWDVLAFFCLSWRAGTLGTGDLDIGKNALEVGDDSVHLQLHGRCLQTLPPISSMSIFRFTLTNAKCLAETWRSPSMKQFNPAVKETCCAQADHKRNSSYGCHLGATAAPPVVHENRHLALKHDQIFCILFRRQLNLLRRKFFYINDDQ